MDTLKGFEKRYLRGLAHSLKPLVYVGQKGITRSLVDAMNDALERHELVKIKFLEVKDKEKKLALIQQIASSVAGQVVGMVGHTASFYRQQTDPERRQINLPTHSDG
jgi:RNA-binding protein